MKFFRSTGGAMGVCAIALLFTPGLAAPFRLVKWAIWGAVLAVMAVRHASGHNFQHSPIPRNRALFITSVVFAAWTILVPWITTPYPTAHAAGSFLVVMGLGFSWLSAFELQKAGHHETWRGLFVLGLGGSLVSLIAFFQASELTLPGFMPGLSREFRVLGTLGNPNWTAGFLLPMPPLLLGVRSWLSEKNESRLVQAACLAMAAFISAATVATGSKAGILALAAGFAGYLLLDPRMERRNRRLAIAGIFVALAVAGSGLGFSGLLHDFPWTRGRLFLWIAGLTLLARHPMTGIGLGGFPAGYPHAIPLITGGDHRAFMPLHRVEFAYNDTLQFAVESGLPSALLYLGLVFLVLRQTLRRGDRLSRGVGAAAAAMAVYGCFDSPLQLPGTQALWCYLLGWMMAGQPENDGQPEKTCRKRLWRNVFLSAGLALLGLFQAVRFSAAEIYWTLASSSVAERNIPQAASHMENAVDYTPENALLLSEAAVVFYRNRDTLRSLETVDRALMTGFSFDDLFLRQKILWLTGHSTEVLNEWKRMAADYPGLFTPHIELGRMYLEKGDVRNARRELGTVLDIRQRGDLNRSYHAEAQRLLDQIRLEEKRTWQK